MSQQITRLALATVLALALAGCASTPEDTTGLEPEPAPQESPAGGAASGSRLAAGLYDMEDGSVQAVGTLERSDLEGGFWVITGGTQAEGNVGETVAVIANGDAFAEQLSQLEGRTVLVLGKRLDGASIRMAGPEIEATGVEEMSDTGGAAE